MNESERMTGGQHSPEVGINLSETASVLFATGSVEGALQQVVESTVTTVEGCDFAGIVVVHGQKIFTRAQSHVIVSAVDALQQEAGDGPCLDAIAEGHTVYADDLAESDRWSFFGPAATAKGIRSMLTLSLASNGVDGALNLYAQYPRAFGVIDRARALILASMAGLVLSAAQSHQVEERRTEDLHAALMTREVIGQAQGILIERERITPDQAFDLLRRASQHLNRKLREVAQDLVETGEWPQTDSPQH
jgi:ANTAR domain/GAF domain